MQRSNWIQLRWATLGLMAIVIGMMLFGGENSCRAQDAFMGPPAASEFEDLPVGIQIAAFVVGGAMILFSLAWLIFILYMLMTFLQALPPQYRLMEPGMVWLLLIPCFNFVWNFFVFARISKSYQNFFNAQGRTDVGDCGAGIGVGYSVCAVLIAIPCLNYVTIWFCFPAKIVLSILYLVKLHGLKKQIQPMKYGM